MIINVLDLETTGLDHETDRVVEVAVIPISVERGIALISSVGRASFVNPGRPIPPEASGIHHITDLDVAGAPGLDEALAAVLFGDPDIIAGHNCRFDRDFLPESLKQKRWLDTYRCAMHVWPNAPNFKNGTLFYWLGFIDAGSGRRAHSALFDAGMTAYILTRLLAERTVEELCALSTKACVLRKVGFGKHFGALWTEVPTDYLQWAERQDFDPDVKFTVKSELARRGGTGR